MGATHPNTPQRTSRFPARGIDIHLIESNTTLESTQDLLAGFLIGHACELRDTCRLLHETHAQRVRFNSLCFRISSDVLQAFLRGLHSLPRVRRNERFRVAALCVVPRILPGHHREAPALLVSRLPHALFTLDAL